MGDKLQHLAGQFRRFAINCPDTSLRQIRTNSQACIQVLQTLTIHPAGAFWDVGLATMDLSGSKDFLTSNVNLARA